MNDIRSNGTKLMLLVVAAYIVLYSFFLCHTQFLPYAMDNNETWSNLGHAKNACDYGFSKSKGLADEATDYTGVHPERHPLVHTHEGNFPRLLPTVLYYLGLKSAESQIAFETFTVGLIALLTAFLLISRLVGASMAAIFCGFMMTDYLMYAQWQVNTWRVWQGVFLFGSLLIADRIARRQERWADWLGLLLITGALFYAELVFASFVFSTVIVYSAIVSWQEKNRRWLGVTLVAISGAGLTVTIFASQLVSYYGLQCLIQDARYTVSARNMLQDPKYLQVAIDFMSLHNVLFLKNFGGQENYHSLNWFLNSLFSGVIGSWTPMLLVLILLAVAGPVAKVSMKIVFATELVSSVRVAVTASSLFFPPFVVGLSIFIGWYFLLCNILKDFYFWIGTGGFYGRFAFAPTTLFGICAILILSHLLTACLLAVAERINHAPMNSQKAALAGCFLFFLALVISRYPSRYPYEWLPVWKLVLQPQSILLLYMAGLVSGSFFATTLLLIENGPLTNRFAVVFKKILPLACAGVGGYIVAWLWSPGYLKTGYLDRCCPILTYLVYLLPAIGVYLLGISSLALVRPYRSMGDWKQNPGIFVSILAAICVAAILVVWVRVQKVSWELIPPDYAQVIKKLEDPKFHGKNIAAYNYVIPLAFTTGGVGSHASDCLLTPNGGESPKPVVLNNGGLWIHDPNQMAGKYIADYYVFLEQPYCYEYAVRRAVQVLDPNKISPGYLHSSIVQSALENRESPFHSKLVALDPSTWGAWAIVELDQESIPYLLETHPNVQSTTPGYAMVNDSPAKTSKVPYVCEYVPSDGLLKNKQQTVVIKNTKNGDNLVLSGRVKNLDEKCVSLHRLIARDFFNTENGSDLYITYAEKIPAGNLYIWAGDNLKILPYDPAVSPPETSISFAKDPATDDSHPPTQKTSASFVDAATVLIDPIHVKITPVYHFKDDAGKSETGSVWRLWAQLDGGETKLLKESSDRQPFVVNAIPERSYLVSVIPVNSSGRKGFEYFSTTVQLPQGNHSKSDEEATDIDGIKEKLKTLERLLRELAGAKK